MSLPAEAEFPPWSCLYLITSSWGTYALKGEGSPAMEIVPSQSSIFCRIARDWSAFRLTLSIWSNWSKLDIQTTLPFLCLQTVKWYGWEIEQEKLFHFKQTLYSKPLRPLLRLSEAFLSLLMISASSSSSAEISEIVIIFYECFHSSVILYWNCRVEAEKCLNMTWDPCWCLCL